MITLGNKKSFLKGAQDALTDLQHFFHTDPKTDISFSGSGQIIKKKSSLKIAIFTALTAHLEICGSSSQLKLDFNRDTFPPTCFCMPKGQNLNE